MKVVFALGLLLMFSFAGTADEPQFRSGRAKEAERAFDAMVSKSQAEYDTKFKAAEKVYVAALTEAKRAAVSADDVDEAIRIETRLKSLKEDLANEQQRGRVADRSGLVVESALLYADGAGRDVTRAIQDQVHGNGIEGISVPGPDLKFGSHKILILRIRYHGQMEYVTLNDETYRDFSIGEDLGSAWKEKVKHVQVK